ncbi:MAG: hypothetical protein VKI63_00470 [Cyanobium sp.]|nr:hypothetical protein [Cyanobium sp.]
MTMKDSRFFSSISRVPGMRKPERITITVPYVIYQGLQERCDLEGRSLSNLAASLLERSLLTNL